jgi:predicted nucleic acid-binding protein
MIVDASVAIKWLAPEEGSDLADRLLTERELAAPDLIFAELANAIWKKRLRGEIVATPPSLDRFSQYFEVIAPCQSLAVRAAELAIELEHPAYDCFYLALAEQFDTVVVSADQRLSNRLAGTAHEKLLLRLEHVDR